MRIALTAIAAAIFLAAPVVATEPQPECIAGEIEEDAVRLLEQKLTPEPGGDLAPLPEGFHRDLACRLLGIGIGAGELAELTTDDILNRLIELQDLTRSRADALLAILKAMKQAKFVSPPVAAQDLTIVTNR